jgi:hypothetical protein
MWNFILWVLALATILTGFFFALFFLAEPEEQAKRLCRAIDIIEARVRKLIGKELQ